jgi:hypothetical protein
MEILHDGSWRTTLASLEAGLLRFLMAKTNVTVGKVRHRPDGTGLAARLW